MFKHDKFEDSPTMRSLTKIAQDKGWIQEAPKPITKQASAPDLVPTPDLITNLVKLCQGLRTSGFDKQAQELEDKFISYKRAQTLYDVSNEKGEDLLDIAHPKGSHKMEDVDSSEAVVEDLLDRHDKFVEVVNSKPTGKISNNQEILAGVKKILAQDMSDSEKKVNSWVDAALSIIDRVGNMVRNEMTIFQDFEMTANRIKDAATNPIVDNLQDMVTEIGQLKTRLKPHSWTTFGLGGITKDTWSKVEPLLNLAIRYVNGALRERESQNTRAEKSMVGEYGEPEAEGAISTTPAKTLQMPEITVSSSPLIGQGTNLINTLKAYQSIGPVARNPVALAWTKSQIGEIQDVMERYEKAEDTGQLDQVKEALQGEMNTKDAEVKDFYSKVSAT
jgi:hypothetical protein